MTNEMERIKELKKLLESVEKLTELAQEAEQKNCPMMQSLQQDHKDFYAWALGLDIDAEEEEKWTHERTINQWKKLHEKLPLPRIFQIKSHFKPSLNTLCLFMDAYPLYLESKK